jgi:leucyl-tRNA synthetase
MPEEAIKDMALGMDETKKWTVGKEVKKVVYVKGKLVSVVAG